ncbi:hypothetical protein C7974DRAFT_461489 [Boeremia exigua]|uniref:uncharacterized protein n=1 Tax=Boeremia exigua TaxID=749465 RepID=UPI001E8E255B|nr:uncharacterized protein C7974DRAFT_461489 [Boeremia exigua]KAH6639253.1 hypothetical protein C7974DRAFT_461489 [Boeremia exigua]
MTTPTPQTWTLRLKHARTTLFLHIDPLLPFSAIKTALYDALTETASDDLSSPASALPPSAEALQLGRPVDPLDASRGFVLGEWEVDDSLDATTLESDSEVQPKNGKGKGKAKVNSKPSDCPKGAGLRDNAVLAYRWEGGAADEGWEVEVASFEDAYGAVNEGDVGGRGEFEG